ncbi:S9 family peptidase [Anditalea andensis]|uniref:Peptidase S9 n=1 Tax=Anditalea andensis TaxID=1048983 RepID=A0A074LGC0_9BACT|nr:prolyl oligopeptidase family serine peptidase [Anditalea andensis]KEO72842.1 peptidase S9 [Anditalea andensis]
MKKVVYLSFICFLLGHTLLAQQKTVQLSDYPRWSSITQPVLSDDGNWFAYSLSPNGADDTLHIRNVINDQIERFPTGHMAVFSDDSKYFSYFTKPDKKEEEQLKKNKKTVYKTAHLMGLDFDKSISVIRAEEAKFTADGKYWAVKRSKAEDDKTTSKGTDLLIHNLESGAVLNIGNVSEFSFNKRGDMLAYLVDANEKNGNGVYHINLKTHIITLLDGDEAIYQHLAWDDVGIQRKDIVSKGRKLTVLKGNEVDTLTENPNALLVFTDLDKKPTKFELKINNEKLADHVISDNSKAYFIENGKAIWFGIKAQSPKIKMSKDTIANVDVWHWNDDRIQSVQMVRGSRDRKATKTAVFHFEDNQYVQLADENMDRLITSRHSRYKVGVDDKPYLSDINWGVTPSDLYRIDIKTGKKTKFAEEVNRALEISPDGKHYIYQKDSALWIYDLDKDQKHNVSRLAAVSFMDMDHPYPHEKPPYGVAGWSKDGRYVIVNHQYDLWLLAIDGSKAENLTRIGSKNEIRFRYENINTDEEWIDLSKPLMLNAYGEWTKKSGYYTVTKGNDPQPLIFEDAMVGSLHKARLADKVVFTKQTFNEFPNYHVSNIQFTSPKMITNANPHQHEYKWGSRKLVDYTNSRGIKLQGTLTLPADYEEGKQYPTIIYFYEKMSDRHHQYSMPVYDDRPHMSTYASNGYMVFMPDNVFEEGRPGTSALDGIISAANKLIESGYADKDNIGLQGHSWSGYQTSFILTLTDMFKCIVTGAPPTNLESFYNNIYGSSGTVHHGIMEIGQVRMGRGVTPWTHREIYQRENPMYHIQNINTPFLILHGTKDGAVDWSQGLELYNAARRMGKEVIFLSYPNEGHHLTNEANQKDFQTRMKAYFDHYLMDMPAPDWMVKGIPHLEKLYDKAE